MYGYGPRDSGRSGEANGYRARKPLNSCNLGISVSYEIVVVIKEESRAAYEDLLQLQFPLSCNWPLLLLPSM